MLAARVLGTGPGSGTDADRAAFFAGAVAPDMGYFPGGDRFASDLAHYVRTGRLVRALVRAAGASAAAAFARGWATHVLADVLVHPLVNRAAAELTHGTASGALATPDGLVAHLRIEQGMDAALGARFGASALWRGASVPSAAIVRLLATAYRETYQFAPPERRLTASCRAVAAASRSCCGTGESRCGRSRAVISRPARPVARSRRRGSRPRSRRGGRFTRSPARVGRRSGSPRRYSGWPTRSRPGSPNWKRTGSPA
ncbi:zinc dependent phospholipase C family protein [Frigoriglobus tundricola]|uniref:zinc dependent phospholipase C family protein n=1 Tax=Frigoriglobus tundricola TaxID=2774151 RepID=UPI00148EE61F|nr:zinc dependent phospholipase C family protein [Frigoriglobus tundricola]